MDGTLRRFITRTVWAEVPRVLEDRWQEGGGFDLTAALRIWWHVYVPLLYTVDTDRLPSSPESKQLANEDPSDVGMLQLHAPLGPAALISCDRDLRRSGLAHEDWIQLRSAVGQVHHAQKEADAASHTATLAVEGTARVLVRTALSRVGTPGGGAADRHSAGGRVPGLPALAPDPDRTDQALPARRRRAIVQHATEVNERSARGETVSGPRPNAARSTRPWCIGSRECWPARPSDDPVEDLVLGARGPGRTHLERMYSLYVLLRNHPMFCEVHANRWQVGRVDVRGALV